MRLKTMTCPNCGSKVRLEKNNKFLTCDYCGNTLFLDEEEEQIQYADPEKAGCEADEKKNGTDYDEQVENIEGRKYEAIYSYML